MNNNSHEKLIKLHKVEKRLLEINNSRGNLPNKISILNEKIDNLVNENKNHESRLSEIESRKTLLNHKISDIENKTSTLNEQMYKVKSNREYEALLSEIDHLDDIEYERYGVRNVRFWSRKGNFVASGARKAKKNAKNKTTKKDTKKAKNARRKNKK